ncbi:MAG TPA: chorismate-binding protein [Kiritimatiellia bacterium]|nr:chorismate-binding protein [Kiritimatiellia bacterium]
MSIRIVTRHPRGDDAWVTWPDPRELVVAHDRRSVTQALDRVAEANRQGRYAVGFLSYEAGSAFDDAFAVNDAAPSDLPLAWFALCDEPILCPGLCVEQTAPPVVRWTPTEGRNAYRKKIQRIKAHIAAGETYQVNYTFPLIAEGPVDFWRLFAMLYHVQPSPYACYLETDDFVIASASPELFFRQHPGVVTVQPMKGTCPRAPHPDLDAAAGNRLRLSEKNRSENIMIVDMMRNDLGRVTQPSRIDVERLFDVSPWPTLWQMTSTIRAETEATLPELMAALFPSASITGAPKIKTSEIIATLETQPRGVYTGAIGWSGPDQRSQWAVAIRTAVKTNNRPARYSVGSGIVWDSSPDEEYRECLLKARILTPRASTPFRLLETMRWEPDAGLLWLNEHLDRMQTAARFFEFPWDRDAVARKLSAFQQDLGPGAQRVRLTLDRRGRLAITHTPLPLPGHFANPESAPMLSVAIDTVRHAIDSPYLYHKTTNRRLYQQALKRHAGVDDVLLINRAGELMEFTTGNVVVQSGTRWLTPPLSSGLLPGVFRNRLVESGTLTEQAITVPELGPDDRLYFINSVRGWRRVELRAAR